MKLDLVGDILKIDKKAYDEIVKLFKQNNINTLHIGKEDTQFDEVTAYVDTDCDTADRVVINRITLDRDKYLLFYDDLEVEYTLSEFLPGSMSYIYNAVYFKLKNIINNEKNI